MFSYETEIEKAEPRPKFGEHAHRCRNPRCGRVWVHSDKMKGDFEAHRCPGCGEFNNVRTYEGYYGT